jgi:hypothetical protein
MPQSNICKSLRKIISRAASCYLYEVLSGLGFYRAKDVGGAATFILMIPARNPPRAHRRVRIYIVEQLSGLLVKAHNRLTQIIRPGVEA